MTIDCTQATPEELSNRQPEKLLWETGDYRMRSQLLKKEMVIERKGKPGGGVRKVPTLAIRAYEGWLYGFDRGEFGGELIYRSANGELVILAEDNFVDIFKMPFGFVAFTKLTHLVLNEGKVYRITRDRVKIRAELSHVLPGAPTSLHLLKSGGVLVQVQAGALSDVNLVPKTFVVREDGSLQEVSCK